MLRPKELRMRIMKAPVDVCPICNRKIQGGGTNSKIVSGSKVLFFVHDECIQSLDRFLDAIKKCQR
jgi:hypothetical protein